MSKKKLHSQFLLCIKNDDYPVSLEVRKIYEAIADEAAAAHKFVRIIDESGEDYLYPNRYFIAVELPKSVILAIRKAS
jgi:hypothetical protein